MASRKRSLILVLVLIILTVFQAIEQTLAAPSAQGAGSERHVGTVSWFNDRKGHGFILEDDTYYFVHFSGIEGDGYRTLEKDQLVLFSIINGRKGPQAVNVVVLEEADARRYVGTVSWFNIRKGHGFIVEDDHYYFVHYSDIEGTGFRVLEAGQQVSFSVINGLKGRQAVDVVVLE